MALAATGIEATVGTTVPVRLRSLVIGTLVTSLSAGESITYTVYTGDPWNQTIFQPSAPATHEGSGTWAGVMTPTREDLYHVHWRVVKSGGTYTFHTYVRGVSEN